MQATLISLSLLLSGAGALLGISQARQPAVIAPPAVAVSRDAKQLVAPAAIGNVGAKSTSSTRTVSVNKPKQTAGVVPKKIQKTISVAPPPAVVPPPIISNGTHEIGISANTTLFELDDDSLDAELANFVALKVSWVRFDLDWNTVQNKSENQTYWRSVDRVVAALTRHHLKPLPILITTPRWARSPQCESSRCPPNDPSQFAAFAAAAATRYAPRGVHTWEIWNEPNMQGSWPGAADPAAYAALLQHAYTAIKAVDPQAFIISGGLGPTATRGGNIAPREFVESLYAAGAGSSFDALGFHPYSFPVPPTYPKDWNAWQQMRSTNSSLRSIMSAHGDGQKQIWITEFGAPTGGPGDEISAETYRRASGGDHVSEQFQAAIFSDALAAVAGATDVGPLIIHTYRDRGTSPHTNENFFGLLRYDGTEKPVVSVLRNR